MKKTLVTLGITVLTTALLAQGKVAMQNSAATVIELTSASALVLAADQSLAGHAVGGATPLLSGHELVAGLYAGTTSTSLALNSPRAGDVRGYVMSNTAQTAGLIPQTTYQLQGIAGGVSAFLQLKVWDAAYQTYEAAFGAGAYTGETGVFPFTPGSSVSYPTISGAILPQSPIIVSLVPEPTTMALAGLGLASLIIFRRRK